VQGEFLAGHAGGRREDGQGIRVASFDEHIGRHVHVRLSGTRQGEPLASPSVGHQNSKDRP